MANVLARGLWRVDPAKGKRTLGLPQTRPASVPSEHPCQQPDLIPLSDCLLRRAPEVDQHNVLATRPQTTRKLNAIWFGDLEAEIRTRNGNSDQYPKTSCETEKRKRKRTENVPVSRAVELRRLRSLPAHITQPPRVLGRDAGKWRLRPSQARISAQDRSGKSILPPPPHTPTHRASVHSSVMTDSHANSTTN